MKRTLALICSVLVLEILLGCKSPHVAVSTFGRSSDTVKTNETSVNADYKVIGELPDSWEVSLSEENKGQILKKGSPVGFIEVIGYAGETTALPNHSVIVRSEDIESALGNGRLYILERSTPAASLVTKSWTEYYALIPIEGRNFAFSVCIDTDNENLEHDLKDMKSILRKLGFK
jgi:hypothetical protein